MSPSPFRGPPLPLSATHSVTGGPPPTGAVVAARLAACDPAGPALPPPPDDVDERVDGLLETLTGARGRMRDIALEELAEMGFFSVGFVLSGLYAAARALDETYRDFHSHSGAPHDLFTDPDWDDRLKDLARG